MLVPPGDGGEDTDIREGPTIKSIPDFDQMNDAFTVPVLLKMGGHIMVAGENYAQGSYKEQAAMAPGSLGRKP